MNAPVIRTLRGTGEQMYGGMLTAPVNRAAEMGVGHDPVPYPASIAPVGGVISFQESVSIGKQYAEDMDTEGPAVYVGYSLGALILGDLLAEGRLPNAIGAVLVSDPKRHRSQSGNRSVSASQYGCAGERFIPYIDGRPVLQLTAPDDPISSLPKGNGFRVMADVVTGTVQPWQIGYVDIGAMASAVGRYLGTPKVGSIPAKASRHVCYGVEKAPYDHRTYMQIAADYVEDVLSEYAAATAVD